MHQEIRTSGCLAAVVMPFPLAARSADVRTAATALMTKHLPDEAMTEHWARITDRLAEDLAHCGFDPIVIAMELCDFEDAVNAEIEQRQRTSRRR